MHYPTVVGFNCFLCWGFCLGFLVWHLSPLLTLSRGLGYMLLTLTAPPPNTLCSGHSPVLLGPLASSSELVLLNVFMEHLLSVQFEATVCASCVQAFSQLQVPPWSDGCCHPPNPRFFLWLSMASQVGHTPQVLWECHPPPAGASPGHFPHSVHAHLPPLFYALSPEFPFSCTEGSPGTERISNSQKAT